MKRLIFLSVGSITSQIAADVKAGWDAEVDKTLPRYFAKGDLAFAERPTISYAPQVGQAFAQAMLTPLSIDNLGLLLDSGWDLRRVLRLAIASVNGVDNASTAGGPTPRIAPEYETYRYFAELASNLAIRHMGDLAVKSQPRVVTSIPASHVTVSDMVQAAQAGFGVETQGESTVLVKSDRIHLYKINPRVASTSTFKNPC